MTDQTTTPDSPVDLDGCPTTRELATTFGHTPTRVLQIARDREVRPLGKTGRSYRWPRDSFDTLRPRPRGRPGVTTGDTR